MRNQATWTLITDSSELTAVSLLHSFSMECSLPYASLCNWKCVEKKYEFLFWKMILKIAWDIAHCYIMHIVVRRIYANDAMRQHIYENWYVNSNVLYTLLNRIPLTEALLFARKLFEFYRNICTVNQGLMLS